MNWQSWKVDQSFWVDIGGSKKKDRLGLPILNLNATLV